LANNLSRLLACLLKALLVPHKVISHKALLLAKKDREWLLRLQECLWQVIQL
jgi:hypothetical protein